MEKAEINLKSWQKYCIWCEKYLERVEVRRTFSEDLELNYKKKTWESVEGTECEDVEEFCPECGELVL